MAGLKSIKADGSYKVAKNQRSEAQTRLALSLQSGKETRPVRKKENQGGSYSSSHRLSSIETILATQMTLPLHSSSLSHVPSLLPPPPRRHTYKYHTKGWWSEPRQSKMLVIWSTICTYVHFNKIKQKKKEHVLTFRYLILRIVALTWLVLKSDVLMISQKSTEERHPCFDICNSLINHSNKKKLIYLFHHFCMFGMDASSIHTALWIAAIHYLNTWNYNGR